MSAKRRSYVIPKLHAIGQLVANISTGLSLTPPHGNKKHHAIKVYIVRGGKAVCVKWRGMVNFIPQLTTSSKMRGWSAP
jgi:hypothetical protein